MIISRDRGSTNTKPVLAAQEKRCQRRNGDIQLIPIVYHAVGGRGNPIAELRGAIVKLYRTGKRIEADAEFLQAPESVGAFRRVLDGRRETEVAAGGKGATPFDLHGAGLRDERVYVQPLAQADGAAMG